MKSRYNTLMHEIGNYSKTEKRKKRLKIIILIELGIPKEVTILIRSLHKICAYNEAKLEHAYSPDI